MDREKKVVVFCASSYSIPQKYNDVAREVVRLLCGKGYGVVSGGAVKGTMGVVADEVIKCGGVNIGVIPRFMKQYLYPQLDTLIWTETMSERKELMRKGTCAAVALPGGIGTLDELVETHVLAKLGKYHGKVIAFNVDGFYDPLKALLDHYVDSGMLNPSDRDLLLFPETVEELSAILDSQN
ncbi:MAG: TIGR00730 family Rossman fold protein [Bacteroidales bacterium]|nr:TIGR00730 family Rossman fold protein [Bacteroidales bacterium]MBQ9713000.1 TIGR00730 family Rossman fold protein [Bacteroidales bacterium]